MTLLGAPPPLRWIAALRRALVGDAVRKTIGRLLPFTLLATLALLLVLTSLEKRLTYDEPYQLDYGYRLLTEGPSVRVRERLPVMALSALPCLVDGCRRSDLDADEGRRLLVRAPSMIFALATGLLLYLWVAEALGAGAARLTLALYVFNPTVLAHGKQVTTDMATAFFTVAALFAAWRFGRRASAAAFACAVLATAGAALSKYTSLYLLVLLPALVASMAWRILRGPAAGRARLRALGLAAVFVVAALLLVNASYGFAGTLTRSGRVIFESTAVRRLAAWNLPLPLPVPYVQGFDFAVNVGETLAFGPNYVLEQRNYVGVWYAYPLMVLLKTPLAFFVLAGLALARGLPRESSSAWRLWLVPSLFHLAYFSLGVRVQIGIRYLLPAVVLLLPLAGVAARGASRAGRLAVGALSVWYAVSSLSYFPHPMCYFNELIGRRIGAYRFLADSNLDWEDRAADIARYRVQHPRVDIAVEPEEPRVGEVLVGANRLLGVSGGPERYRYLRRLSPIDHVGYSFLLFHVTPADLPAARRREPAQP
jgi:hypothetical protein